MTPKIKTFQFDPTVEKNEIEIDGIVVKKQQTHLRAKNSSIERNIDSELIEHKVEENESQNANMQPDELEIGTAQAEKIKQKIRDRIKSVSKNLVFENMIERSAQNSPRSEQNPEMNSSFGAKIKSKLKKVLEEKFVNQNESHSFDSKISSTPNKNIEKNEKSNDCKSGGSNLEYNIFKVDAQSESQNNILPINEWVSDKTPLKIKPSSFSSKKNIDNSELKKQEEEIAQDKKASLQNSESKKEEETNVCPSSHFFLQPSSRFIASVNDLKDLKSLVTCPTKPFRTYELIIQKDKDKFLSSLYPVYHVFLAVN